MTVWCGQLTTAYSTGTWCWFESWLFCFQSSLLLMCLARQWMLALPLLDQSQLLFPYGKWTSGYLSLPLRSIHQFFWKINKGFVKLLRDLCLACQNTRKRPLARHSHCISPGCFQAFPYFLEFIQYPRICTQAGTLCSKGEHNIWLLSHFLICCLVRKLPWNLQNNLI